MRMIAIVILLILLLVMLFARPSDAYAQVPVHSHEAYHLFGEVPYHVAKNFSDQNWYWWAKIHNKRSYEKAAMSRKTRSRGVLSETMIDINGNYFYPEVKGRVNQKTFQRAYEYRSGGLPAVIYNPYCR